MKTKLTMSIAFLLLCVNVFAQWNVVFNNDIFFYDIQCVNADTAFASGLNNELNGVILRTMNGGNTWDTTTFNCYELYSVNFPSASVGYTCGYGNRIFKTTDCGNTWLRIDSIGLSGYIYSWKSICFLNNDTGYISNGSQVFKTKNGGNSWLLENALVGIQSIKYRNGLLYGFHEMGGYISTDKGTSWNQFNIYLTEASVCGISFYNIDIGFITANAQNGVDLSNYGVVGSTMDGCQSWQTQDIFQVYVFGDICSTDEKTAYACAYGQALNFSGIIKTVNGGETWGEQTVYDQQTQCYPQSFTSISCIDNDVCYIAGAGWIVKTTNGGGQITPFESITDQNSFLDNNCFIHPNPYSYTAILTLNRYLQNGSLIIYDIIGREIKSMQNLEGTKITLTREDMQSGMYLYSLSDAKGLIGTGKMVVE
ncbi:MAG: YCF48-related protein [Bacteroidia bacterium]|nr:YCF48-related protein [Bacteroidia bacterium]